MAESNPDLYKHDAVRTPTIADLAQTSSQYGFHCSEDELGEFQEYIGGLLKSYQKVNSMVAPTLPVKYARTPGYQPKPEDNIYNQWYWKCDIAGAADGILKGKTVAIKDNVCVAGVPMMNGSAIMKGYVPDVDATVVTRILDAGGVIKGKTNCEHMSFSGSSWTNDNGPTLNPYDTSRSTGGSSGGNAVAILKGEVDVGIGGDQGGSIRIPSSWCGIVGLKPTWGLVPYTGGVPIEITCDHLGPMARTVTDCALLLEAIAGRDGERDSRQPRDLTVPKYSQLLTKDLGGKKVGLLLEGFKDCEEDVKDMVTKAANRLAEAGAKIEEVSVQMHDHGSDIWGVICTEGAFKCMVQGEGAGYHYKGYYPTSMTEKLRCGYNTQGRNFSDVMKLTCLFGEYITKSYGSKFYGMAQNLNLDLTAAYDKALDTYDVLIMPTAPYKAPLLPKEGAGINDRLKNALSMVHNTAPFDCTGHPAITINAGMSQGLPVGMMIVGKQFDDASVLRVAYAFEQLRDSA